MSARNSTFTSAAVLLLAAAWLVGFTAVSVLESGYLSRWSINAGLILFCVPAVAVLAYPTFSSKPNPARALMLVTAVAAFMTAAWLLGKASATRHEVGVAGLLAVACSVSVVVISLVCVATGRIFGWIEAARSEQGEVIRRRRLRALVLVSTAVATLMAFLLFWPAAFAA